MREGSPAGNTPKGHSRKALAASSRLQKALTTSYTRPSPEKVTTASKADVSRL